MELKPNQHICQICGGEVVLRDGSFVCLHCSTSFADSTVQNEAATLQTLLDDQKREKVANLRRSLYDALHAPYVDSDSICRICREIRYLLPDDFLANFYETANGKNEKRIAALIESIDVSLHADYVEGILDFLLRSFNAEYHLPLANLVERAYRNTDLRKLEHYNTRLSEEAVKDSAGVYETCLPRDVFVAYSGRDMHHVQTLVSCLEQNGLTCFVAARNLRHGKGAVQNYQSAIKEALSNSKTLVFVSSPNSRSFSCDALKFELPFLKQGDLEGAPYEYRQSYLQLPAKYKKPRVEYRVEDGGSEAADLMLREYFSGTDCAFTPEEVASRVFHLITEGNVSFTPAPPPPPPMPEPMPVPEPIPVPAPKQLGPAIIRNIQTVGVNDVNNFWPRGATISSTVDKKKHRIICFQLGLKRAYTSYQNIVLHCDIFDGYNNLFFSDSVDISVEPGFDRLAKTWILVGDDGSEIQNGSYRAEFSIGDTVPVSYQFFVIDSRIQAPAPPPTPVPTPKNVPVEQKNKKKRGCFASFFLFLLKFSIILGIIVAVVYCIVSILGIENEALALLEELLRILL